MTLGLFGGDCCALPLFVCMMAVAISWLLPPKRENEQANNDGGDAPSSSPEPPAEPAALLVPNDVFDLEDPLPDYPMQARVKPEWMKVLGRGVVRESKARWN